MVGASPRHVNSLFHLFHLPNSGAIQAVYCPWSRQGCPADAQVRETGDNINPFRIFVVGEVLPTGTLEHSHGQALNISAAGLTFLQKEVLLDALDRAFKTSHQHRAWLFWRGTKWCQKVEGMAMVESWWIK